MRALQHTGVRDTASRVDSGYGVSYPADSRYGPSGRHFPDQGDQTRADGPRGMERRGSGCSAYGRKAEWQTDTGCARMQTV